MSKTNALTSLMGQYDSDDEDYESNTKALDGLVTSALNEHKNGDNTNIVTQPPPLSNCAWSACYDENSGYTYYWNVKTNEVTWEPPQEYLLALKALQSNKKTISNNISIQKQNTKLVNSESSINNTAIINQTQTRDDNKRKTESSDSEDEKIEPITSFHYSDSDSHDENGSPRKRPRSEPKLTKKTMKKKKKTIEPPVPMEYGPSLPSNQEYTVPIGPQLPPHLMQQEDEKLEITENKEVQDESAIVKQICAKAILLKKLGGELPRGVDDIIKESSSPHSGSLSPKNIDESSQVSQPDVNVDDFLSEIEKELPKIKANTDPERKPLFPSSQIIEENVSLFPSAQSISTDIITPILPKQEEQKTEKPVVNIYMTSSEEVLNKRRRRIDSDLLPETKSEPISYTTKYAQYVDGFTEGRTGLGFSTNHDTPEESSKSKSGYLIFKKGETLNETKEPTIDGESMDSVCELLEAKLKFLNLQLSPISPVQEMIVQMQTLNTAYKYGALTAAYWAIWLKAATESLGKLEENAAPEGWKCEFHRQEGRYRYVRVCDGVSQWEYPVVTENTVSSEPQVKEDDDMELSLTPPPPPMWRATTPPPGCEDMSPPPLPPPPPVISESLAPPPPPPKEDPPSPPASVQPAIGDELMSFYNDIAEIEKKTPQEEMKSVATTMSVITHAPVASVPPEVPSLDPADVIKKQNGSAKPVKKKTKVKISSGIGMKSKNVSNLVAKWQQVQEEISSD